MKSSMTLFILLVFFTTLEAQQFKIHVAESFFSKPTFYHLNINKSIQKLSKTSYITPNSLIVKPADYVSTLSIFCRLEWKFEKNYSLPLKVRLGEFHYTELLEGKGRGF
jgi:hypothetical protein